MDIVDEFLENVMEATKKRPKINRVITIDYYLNEKLKAMKINVSGLVENFLRHYITRKEKLKDNNKADKEQE